MSTATEPIHELALSLLADIKNLREGKLKYNKAREIANHSTIAISAMTKVLITEKQLDLQEKKLIIRNKELIFKEKELEYKIGNSKT